ncbi:hypothetical protein HRbin38_00014 [bacterium HR38]|nr:hypothetical protein HRbin38_00014 [bacterium HR38]
MREKARELGFQVLGERESPLPGKEGNREFWLRLRKPQEFPYPDPTGSES